MAHLRVLCSYCSGDAAALARRIRQEYTLFLVSFMLFAGDKSTDEEKNPAGVITVQSFYSVPNSLGHFLSSPNAQEVIEAGSSNSHMGSEFFLYRLCTSMCWTGCSGDQLALLCH